MADPATFLHQLSEVGIKARVETDLLGFDFPDFDSAWKALAGVPTAHLPAQRQEDARPAVLDAMYPRGDGPRHFRNLTQFIVGQART